ncbi:MAG: hypothetical protein ACKVOH_05465 [Chlamydiales bacterium]
MAVAFSILGVLLASQLHISSTYFVAPAGTVGVLGIILLALNNCCKRESSPRKGAPVNNEPPRSISHSHCDFAALERALAKHQQEQEAAARRQQDEQLARESAAVEADIAAVLAAAQSNGDDDDHALAIAVAASQRVHDLEFLPPGDPTDYRIKPFTPLKPHDASACPTTVLQAYTAYFRGEQLAHVAPQMQALDATYYFIPINGNGNCFYYSVSVGVLHYLMGRCLLENNIEIFTQAEATYFANHNDPIIAQAFNFLKENPTCVGLATILFNLDTMNAFAQYLRKRALEAIPDVFSERNTAIEMLGRIAWAEGGEGPTTAQLGQLADLALAAKPLISLENFNRLLPHHEYAYEQVKAQLRRIDADKRLRGVLDNADTKVRSAVERQFHGIPKDRLTLAQYTKIQLNPGEYAYDPEIEALQRTFAALGLPFSICVNATSPLYHSFRETFGIRGEAGCFSVLHFGEHFSLLSQRVDVDRIMAGRAQSDA